MEWLNFAALKKLLMELKFDAVVFVQKLLRGWEIIQWEICGWRAKNRFRNQIEKTSEERQQWFMAFVLHLLLFRFRPAIKLSLLSKLKMIHRYELGHHLIECSKRWILVKQSFEGSSFSRALKMTGMEVHLSFQAQESSESFFWSFCVFSHLLVI